MTHDDIQKRLAEIEAEKRRLLAELNPREAVPDWLSAGWYATLKDGRQVLVAYIDTLKAGKRSIRCLDDKGRLEVHPLSDFKDEAVNLPYWMTKGRKVRMVANGREGVITGVRRNKYTMHVTVRFDNGNTLWLHACDIVPAED